MNWNMQEQRYIFNEYRNKYCCCQTKKTFRMSQLFMIYLLIRMIVMYMDLLKEIQYLFVFVVFIYNERLSIIGGGIIQVLHLLVAGLSRAELSS